jgi:hypothetical protein
MPLKGSEVAVAIKGVDWAATTALLNLSWTVEYMVRRSYTAAAAVPFLHRCQEMKSQAFLLNGIKL